MRQKNSLALRQNRNANLTVVVGTGFLATIGNGATVKNTNEAAATIARLAVPIMPWVGKDYELSVKRLLILGESHYDEVLVNAPADSTRAGAIRDYTNREWSEYLKRKTGRFWTNIIQVVQGAAIEECEISAVAHRVAFYNYCNQLVGNAARIAPRSSLWQESRDDFYRVLNAIQPTHILVLGQRLWTNLSEDERGEEITIGKKSKNVCYFCAAGTLVPSLPINHPSSAFSWREQRPWVESLLAKSYH